MFGGFFGIKFRLRRLAFVLVRCSDLEHDWWPARSLRCKDFWRANAMSSKHWTIPAAFANDPRTRRVMPKVLKAFGPIDAVVDHVGPLWAAFRQPDLFDEPTTRQTVVRHLEYRIFRAGQLWWTMTWSPSVADIRERIEELQKHVSGIDHIMRRTPQLRRAFNTVASNLSLDVLEDILESGTISEQWLVEELEKYLSDPWERYSDANDNAWTTLDSLQWEGTDLGALLGQPPTRHKRPDTVLWEEIFKLLQECGIEPMGKHQDLIITMRAVHELFGLEEPPRESTFYPTVKKFRDSSQPTTNQPTQGSQRRSQSRGRKSRPIASSKRLSPLVAVRERNS